MRKQGFMGFKIRSCNWAQLLFLSIMLVAVMPEGHAQSNARDQILGILKVQTNAWNQGDLDRFMQTYWKHDSLMFIGKNGVTYGWQNTLDNYKKFTPIKRQWELCPLIS